MRLTSHGLFADLDVAWRSLRRARGLTTAAALTLALGVAATTTMFAFVDAVMLRPLPVRDQAHLIVAWNALAGDQVHHPFGVGAVETLAHSSRLLERVAGVSHIGATPTAVVDAGQVRTVQTVSVTGDFFAVLGANAAVGRALAASDDRAGAERVLVISHRFWQREYGGSQQVIGRHLTIGEQPFTIVGVMPPGLEYPRGVEAWMPVAAETSILANAAFRVDVELVARMRQGVSVPQALSELRALAGALDADAPDGVPRGAVPAAESLTDALIGDVRTWFAVLSGAVALVLLIAGINVANLLLARGESRRLELATRAALGAGRGHIVRQLLAEGMVLAVMSGAAGVVLAWLAIHLIPAMIPGGLPRTAGIGINTLVALFACAVSTVSALLATLAPALRVVRADLLQHLRHDNVAAAGGQRSGRALVVAQMALAVMVVAAAALVTRSLLRLVHTDTGFAAEQLVVVSLDLPSSITHERAQHLRFLQRVVPAIESTPGVVAATAINVPPFEGAGWSVPQFTAEGQDVTQIAANPSLALESVFPDYFATFGMSIVRGRAFTDADRNESPSVAIVSADVAARAWPGQDPIGRRIRMGGIRATGPWYTVVGIVQPTRYRSLLRTQPTLYLPAQQFLVAAQTLALRTTVPASTVAVLVRSRLRMVDTRAHVVSVIPLSQRLDEQLARARFTTLLVGLFASAALALAVIGLYAMMAASVRRRARELGVRMALGATAADVRRLVLGEGARVAGAGAAIGLAIAVACGRVMRGILFEIQPLDSLSLISAALLLMAASLIAVGMLAQAAARHDPTQLLRTE